MKKHESDLPLTDHEGILRVETHPDHAVVDVEFDPSKLSDSEVRSLLKEHIAEVESAIRKSTLRINLRMMSSLISHCRSKGVTPDPGILK